MSKNITRLAYIHKISNANENILDKSVVKYDVSYTNPRVRKIDIKVDKDCKVIINDTSEIKVLASLGLSINYDDFIIDKLVIVEPGVSIYAILGY